MAAERERYRYEVAHDQTTESVTAVEYRVRDGLVEFIDEEYVRVGESRETVLLTIPLDRLISIHRHEEVLD